MAAWRGLSSGLLADLLLLLLPCASSAASTCSSVTISDFGDFGDFSGTYEEESSVLYDEYYSMTGSVGSYSLYVFDDAWYLLPDDGGYPKFRTFDDAVHPSDITQEWGEATDLLDDFSAGPWIIPITCAGSSSVTSSTLSTSDNDDGGTTTGSTSPSPTPSPTAAMPGANEQTEETSNSSSSYSSRNIPSTPSPSPSDAEVTGSPGGGGDGAPTLQEDSETNEPSAAGTVNGSAAPALGAASSSEATGDAESDGDGGALSSGVVAALAIVGSAIAVAGVTLCAIKVDGNVHCCQRIVLHRHSSHAIG